MESRNNELLFKLLGNCFRDIKAKANEKQPHILTALETRDSMTQKKEEEEALFEITYEQALMMAYEEIKDAASNQMSEVTISDIPDDEKYYIISKLTQLGYVIHYNLGGSELLVQW